jgi:diguanylate cyclase (GGDEF)-like protein
VAVLFLDLDHFKQLNDRLGHDAGDAALRATGRALLAATRATDLVARLGGDEFAVILPEVDRAAAGQAGQRMWEAVTAALDPYPGVTSSAGVAWFGDPAPSLSTMLKAADSLMYQAKRERRGAVIVQDLSSERAGTASTGSLNAGPDPPAGPPGA